MSMMPLQCLLILCVYPLLVAAIGYPEPAQTQAGIEVPPSQPPPAITPSPRRFGRISPNALFRRETNQYNICGSMVGDDDITSPLTCDDDNYTCLYDTTMAAIGCCRSSDAPYNKCRIHTTCVNEEDKCLDDCQANPLIKKCSSPTPSCATWRWPDGFSSFECDSVTFSVDVMSAKQYRLPGKVAATATGSDDIGFTVEIQSVRASSSGTAGASSKQKDDSPNVGAIAGGVAGGVVFLLLVGVGIWFWRRKRRVEPEQYPQYYEPQKPPYYVPQEMPSTADVVELPHAPYGYEDTRYEVHG